MNRFYLVLVLLLVFGETLAQGTHEIECALFGSGGGSSGSATFAVQTAAGQGVVGVSTSTTYSLRHNPWPWTSSVSTGVGDEDELPSIEFLGLHPNEPNPFNPTTRIRYDVPAGAGQISLRVYDVTGRQVRTLIDGFETEGRKSLVWDGRDDRGRQVASGVYYAVLLSEEVRLTQKMTLLK